MEFPARQKGKANAGVLLHIVLPFFHSLPAPGKRFGNPGEFFLFTGGILCHHIQYLFKRNKLGKKGD